MKTNTPHRLHLFWALAIVFSSVSAAQADTLDVFAGYNASTNNSYFEIQDNTAFNFTNVQFTATAAGASDPTSIENGWSTNLLSVADISAGDQSLTYFNGAQAFQTNFPASYAYTGLIPSDLTYTLSGDLNGQLIQLTFSGGDGATNGPAFLGLDQFGNATGQSDFGQVASYAVAAVPLPGAFYLFASSLLGFVVSRTSRKPVLAS